MNGTVPSLGRQELGSSSGGGDIASSSLHITDLIAASKDEPFFSLEFFPPKTEQGLANLYSRMARMIEEVRPAWVQITWGAGGSTQSTSLDLAGRIQNGQLDSTTPLQGAHQQRQSLSHLQRNACLHLTCTNVEKGSLDQTLDESLKLGVRNILALRGDPPRGQEYWIAADDRFQHATDLVKYIREKYGDNFCIGVAGYPESHPDVDPSQSGDDELFHLLAKQEAGANFIVTQLFYDVEAFLSWYRKCRDYGITLPILPGIMPIQNYQSFRRMTKLCKVNVPQDVWDGLEPNRHDDAAVKEFGVEHSLSIIMRIQKETDIRGFHLCTLNLENSIKRLIDRLGWLKANEVPDHGYKLVEERVPKAPSEYKVSATNALQSAFSPTSQPVWSSNGKPATQELPGWDDFPNGRYGDARSPAFGEMDGYGVSLKVPPADALKLWSYPVSEADISTIFVDYLQGTISSIPWCDVPVFNETKSIQKELLALNSQGWWTVGSQPSVDGIESTDPTFGFGPRLGYIFQKAFVEFFITEQEMIQLEARIQENNEKNGSWLSYFAGNRKGDLKSNVRADEGQSCAVTWGCFVGKEVVQSTIIEEESFKAWRDEAFAIWSEWELLFPLKSQTRKLLHSIGEERWLVTVIHHDYKREDTLWNFLLPSSSSYLTQ